MMKAGVFFLVRLVVGSLLFLAPLRSVTAFDKVVIWGHKLHSHTHSYIHNAFYIAFKHLGYDTYWFDNSDDVSGFDFANTLFLTEGQVDQKIPVRDDCRYILHNCNRDKYESLKKEHVVALQVYTDAVLSNRSAAKVDPCIYYDLKHRVVYMPWATDLLPDEIDQVKAQLKKEAKENRIYWIGTVGDGRFGNVRELMPFIQACEESGIEFVKKVNVGLQEHAHLIGASYMAPTIVGTWQAEVGYIPCRIFKNISYGQMGLTNSRRVYELFEGKIVYNADTHQLFYDAEKRMEQMSQEELFELMDLVKNKHTYLNRIATLLDFLDLVERN